MLSIIIFASTLNTLIYDEKDLRIEDQPRNIYIVWFHRETILLLAPSPPPRSVDRSRRILFSRKGFNLEKTFTNLQSRPKKTCEEIKSVNPRRNFPPDSTSLRSIPQHPPLSLFYPSLSVSLCFLYDPLIQRAAEQPNLDNKARREQRQKTLTAMLYKVVHPDSDNLVSARGCRPTREWSVIVLISQHAPGTYLYVLLSYSLALSPRAL